MPYVKLVDGRWATFPGVPRLEEVRVFATEGAEFLAGIKRT
jgi:hypothetical protein